MSIEEIKNSTLKNLSVETKPTTKKCPHCQLDVSIKAKKCPHCQGDLRHWSNRHLILTILLMFMVFMIGISIISLETEKNKKMWQKLGVESLKEFNETLNDSQIWENIFLIIGETVVGWKDSLL